MIRLLCILYFLLFLVVSVYPVDFARAPSARSVGMGYCVATQSALFNPALLSFSTRREISVNYYSSFMMKELSSFSLLFKYSVPVVDMGLYVSSFGSGLYRENFIMCMGSKRIKKQWTLGASLSYRMLRIVEWERAPSFLAADIGIMYTPSKEVCIGFSCVNIPLMNTLLKMNRYSIRAGLSWQLLSSVLLTADVENTVKTPISGNLGVEYTLFDTFNVRAGICTDPLVPSVGIGYTYALFTLDGALAYHSVLGVSTGITLKASF